MGTPFVRPGVSSFSVPLGAVADALADAVTWLEVKANSESRSVRVPLNWSVSRLRPAFSALLTAST